MAWCGSDTATPRALWFNPENDIALARNDAHFTPPKAACELSESGSALPLWYGDDADYVMGQTPCEAWIEEMHEAFGIDGSRMATRALLSAMPQPWGWSEYAREHYIRCGFPDNALPSHATLAKMRQLSHRRTAALISRRLHDALPSLRLAPAATECTDIRQVRAFLNDNPHAYLKSPWSSSGRGVMCTSTTSDDSAMRFAAGSIKQQGSVMAERAYDRVIDFAQLFESRSGKVRHLGTSVFATRSAGIYSGNLLAPETDRFGIAAAHAGADNLLRVTEELIHILEEEISPYYQGVMGVDMLVDRSGMLDAAVELNLRTTMGYVANRIYDRFMVPGDRGVFRVVISHPNKPYDFRAHDGKLAEGTLRLNPSGRFVFEAEVTKP